MTDDILLPIANFAVNPLTLIAIGFIGGIFTGMLGIGGGIFITPILIVMGIPSIIAVASQVNCMIGITFIGYLSYQQKHDVDVKLGLLIISGGVVGAYAGVSLLSSIHNPSIINFIINYGYICTLAIMGMVLLGQSLKNLKRINSENPVRTPLPPTWVTSFPFVISLKRTRIRISILIPMIAGTINGILIAILGMGNGVFLMPTLTYLVGRLSPVVYGTTLMTSVVITLWSTWTHAIHAGSIDIILVFFLLIGGLIGGQLGVRFSYLMPRPYLGFIAVFIMLMVILELLTLKIFPTFFDDLITHPQFSTISYSFPVVKELAQQNPYVYGMLSIGMTLIMAIIFKEVINLIERLLTSRTSSDTP